MYVLVGVRNGQEGGVIARFPTDKVISFSESSFDVRSMLHNIDSCPIIGRNQTLLIFSHTDYIGLQ